MPCGIGVWRWDIGAGYCKRCVERGEPARRRLLWLGRASEGFVGRSRGDPAEPNRHTDHDSEHETRCDAACTRCACTGAYALRPENAWAPRNARLRWIGRIRMSHATRLS